MKRVTLIVVLALVVVAGCLPTPSPWTGTGPHLGIVGDSQIFQLQHDNLTDPGHHMTDFFVGQGYAVSDSTLIGAGTGDLPVVWPAPGADIVVIALGTNDMHDGAVPLATAEANYANYLASLGAACTVGVEIPETAPWQLDTYGPAWNAWMASQVDVVVPWAAALNQHLTGTGAWVGTDGVHQTPTGKFNYLLSIYAGVKQCP